MKKIRNCNKNNISKEHKKDAKVSLNENNFDGKLWESNKSIKMLCLRYDLPVIC